MSGLLVVAALAVVFVVIVTAGLYVGGLLGAASSRSEGEDVDDLRRKYGTCRAANAAERRVSAPLRETR